VLVVDEAGMVGTRQLARLLAHAREQEVKVVLVGDPRQMPAIEAVGLYTSLAEQLGAITLDTNRRQTHRWEAEALDQLRHGDVHAAVDAYRQHSRIVTDDTADAHRERLVGNWWHQTRAEGGDTIMSALRRTDVTDLNMRARIRLAGVGELWGPERLLPDDTVVQAGDRIVCLRNDRRLGVANGTRATVTWGRGRRQHRHRAHARTHPPPRRLPRRRPHRPRLRDHGPQGPRTHRRRHLRPRLRRPLTRVGLRRDVTRPAAASASTSTPAATPATRSQREYRTPL
jgi:hypothetical protein